MHAVSRRLFSVLVLFAALFAVGCGGCGSSSGKPLRLATTTSVVDSGLLKVLLPAFEKKAGYKIEVASVGSGKALAQLAEGDADVAVTHAPKLEKAAVEKGDALQRTPFMHNEFVLVGPKEEVSRVAGAGDFRKALQQVAASGKKFVSRGDGSGTHTREKELWKEADIDAEGSFILSAKAGMAQTLKKASEEKAFALTDKGTFLAHKSELSLVIVFQGDEELRNVYSVIEPKDGGKADSDGAKAFAQYVRSPEGRALIGAFGTETLGEPLFTPEE